MRVIIIAIFSLFVLSCGNNVPIDESSSRTLPFEGYLHGDTQNISNSSIEYNNTLYKIANTSSDIVTKSITSVSSGQAQATSVKTYGSINVISVEFDGVIQDGSSDTIHISRLIIK